MTLYRDMDQAALDAGYNNSTAVANSAALMADFTERSAQLRLAQPRHLDLPYGAAPRNRIDYFSAAASSAGVARTTPAPVLVFIHGGYWQTRAKENFSFLAHGPLAHGIDVALPGYTLAPDISLTGLVGEIRAALTWLQTNVGQLGGDAQQLYLAGWSAGGHLTAAALDHPAVQGGLAISGIYDLEPIRLSYLNAKLGLDIEEARLQSPALHIASASPPLMLACGGAELPELQRQSRDYAAARAQAGLPGRLTMLDGLNHFTILEELASPDGVLTNLVRELTRN